MRATTRLAALLAAALVLCAPLAATAVAKKPPAGLRIGLDETSYQEPANQAVAFARTRDARASIARIVLRWYVAAPTAPPSSAQARDPNWSGYRWGQFDAQVQAARAVGVEPLMLITAAPAWAEGSDKPADAPPTAWKPSASAFRDFAEAAARRYSGSIQPRVRYWQAWNEPNVNIELAPLWTQKNGRYVATGPRIYKGLLNAFYDGVKAASSSNFVVTAGTAPYGKDPGDIVMRPAYFWRQVLCVKGGRKPRAKSSCSGGPARFDALAHHPYSIGAPSRSAINSDDVAVPDLQRLTRPLKLAKSKGYVYPKRSKQLWITEIAYDSNPPDPGAFSQARQAKYLEASFYLLWKQGVDAINWFLLRDAPEGPLGWAYTRQSGLYLRGATIGQDQAKPALTAFRFPFTAYRRSSRSVALWGIAPAKGKVVVERAKGSSWKVVRRLKARGKRVFAGSLKVANGTVLRARQSGETSLAWKVSKTGP
jgi:hypothetical protein